MDNQEKCKGQSVIAYRWGKITNPPAGSFLEKTLSFLLHTLALVVVLPFALLQWGLNVPIRKLYKEVRSFSDEADSNAKKDLIDRFVKLIVFLISIILLFLLIVLTSPFWILYWAYQFFERLCSYSVIQYVLIVFILGALLFGLWKSLSIFGVQN